MISKAYLEGQNQMLGTLRTLAEAYEQISVIRIQRVRGSVLTTRDFLDGLADIFKDVKQSYRDEVEQLLKKHKNSKESLSGLQKNGKTIAILLSSNNKLYGDIVFRVFNLFIQDVRKNNYDVVIIGKVGKAMFDQQGLQKDYLYFDMPDEDAKLSDIAPVIKKIEQYQKIFVYYGRFLNIVSQEPAISEVLGDGSLLDKPLVGGDEKEKHTPFFFEPSLKKILAFFETQMFSSVLKQVVDESELSRLASRIKSMEDSLGTIEKEQEQLHKTELRAKRMIENSKQLQRLSGIALWQHR